MKARSLVVALAALALLAAGGAASSTDAELHVVLLSDPSLAAYSGGVEGLAPTSPEVTGEPRLDAESAASQAYLAHLAARHDAFLATAGAALGREVTARFRYDAVLNGVAVRLTDGEAAVVAGLPGVTRVVKEFHRELLTDVGPEWIGAPAAWSGDNGHGATQGEGIVVGIIDSGVNHGHPSLAAVGPVDGYQHENPRGRYYGACDPVTGAPFCNAKLIGFWDFSGTTPEDNNGHGSHVASTAAGNVVDAALVGPTTTVDARIKGVAPHANVISYKACPLECPITSILASINQATLDGVDVVNYSIGSPNPFDPWEDPDAQAFLDARRAGLFVATSAGNSGPGPSTIGSPADSPWLMTVGASTHERKFINSVVDFTGGDGPLAGIEGKSVTAGYGPAKIVYAGDYGSALCGDGPAAPTGESAINPFPPGTFDGEIVICDRGTYGRVHKSLNVKEGGAGGYILANDAASGDSLVADAYHVPGVHITYADGVRLKAWLRGDSQGRITGSTLDVDPAHGDVMGSFSSRGPSGSVPSVLKPDVTAPGVDIYAAFNLDPLGPTAYGVISGTSMSSPHAAGAAALVRAQRPEWSPDEVRSALVSTAFTTMPGVGKEEHGVLKEDAATPADPFDMGGGRIDLRLAGKAGLVLDETPSGYDQADPKEGGDPASLNLPTLASEACAGTCHWTRVVKSSASTTVTWTVSTLAPDGASLTVSPSSFTVAPGETRELLVRLDVRAADENGWKFGQVVLRPSLAGLPEQHLTIAANKVPGQGSAPIRRTTLHFHGNAHDGCTGNGNADLLVIQPTCPDGPTLSRDPELDSGEPATFVAEPLLTCAPGFDRCAAEPNWLWRPSEPAVLEGPMTVEFWWSCPACLGRSPVVVWFNEDFTIRLFVDGVEHVNETVRNLSALPGAARLVRATVDVPRVTANERVVLRIEPWFIHHDAAVIYYDSQQRCTTGVEGPCDSRVQMPIVVEQAPDLVVADATATNTRPREGDRVTITATVANTGDADAPASVTEFLLDGQTVLGTVETPAIAAGGSAQVSVGWDTRGVKGQHTIEITADSGEAVAESNEDNNAGTLTVTVKGNKVQNGSFEQSSNGSSPDHWSGAGQTSYDGDSASAGPTGSWTSDPIAVTPGASYDLIAAATGSLGTIVVQQLSASGLVLGSVSLPALGLLETAVSVGADATQLRIVLKGGITGTTFDDVGLFEQ